MYQQIVCYLFTHKKSGFSTTLYCLVFDNAKDCRMFLQKEKCEKINVEHMNGIIEIPFSIK
jgi:phage anti-repressor protein